MATPLTLKNALPETMDIIVMQGEGRNAREVHHGLLQSGRTLDLWEACDRELFLVAVPVVGGWEPLEPVCMSSSSRGKVKDKLTVADR